MASILVTGGAGFIGANFVRWALTHSHHHIVIIDKLSYAGHLANIQEILDGSRATFIQEDIANSEAMKRVIFDHAPQAILNFAAESHVDRSIESPEAFIHSNIVGTFVLLESARTFFSNSSGGVEATVSVSPRVNDEVYGACQRRRQKIF